MLRRGERAEAKNLEAISRAIDQHNTNCPFPAAEVRMNPFEAERLGWEEIRGLPVVPDAEIGTGRFRIVCSRDMEGEGIEEAEALGIPIEVAVPSEPMDDADCPGTRLRPAGLRGGASTAREMRANGALLGCGILLHGSDQTGPADGHR